MPSAKTPVRKCQYVFGSCAKLDAKLGARWPSSGIPFGARNANANPAARPGSRVQRKTPRAPSAPSNAVAHSGPSTAPIVSIARSNPNARPSCPGATAPASSVSRDGPRLPRPTHPSARITRIAGQLGAKAYANVESPVAKYPMMPVGLRKRGRSAIQPPANFAKLESPSETPSITPSANAGAPRPARNAGRIAVAASWPQSEKRLASPMPSTPRVSQLLGGGIGAGRDAGEGTFMVHAPRVSAPRLRQRAPRPMAQEKEQPPRKYIRPTRAAHSDRATTPARANY